jgi:hypothetical protein
MFFNWTIPQLLFLIYPQIMTNITAFDVQFGTARFVARFAVTILWYILAIKILFAVFPNKRST